MKNEASFNFQNNIITKQHTKILNYRGVLQKILSEILTENQLCLRSEATFWLPFVLPEFMEGPPSGAARLTATEGSRKARAYGADQTFRKFNMYFQGSSLMRTVILRFIKEYTEIKLAYYQRIY